ncbi:MULTISPECIES: pyridoxamine 5'-phosphate oxidase family protein [unclassified Rhodococcus (in: high G+C Gram-positive bacteria)]|uniref:pyridoxamine 5'-phosphate oxidase family protein n=1 Tax=Rhodococcus sp. SJ-3 TaxID=3454628 RepID=UPI003F797AFD
MTTAAVTTTIDVRYGEPGAEPTSWPETEALFASAPLYWVSTIHTTGRPHVAPLVGVWHGGAFHLTVGPGEQKALNLVEDPRIAVTTGRNDWDAGVDVVLEGEAHRVTDHDALTAIAAAYFAKYGEAWRFEVGEGGFGIADEFAWVFRIPPRKVLVFAKKPHGQTTHRFG